MRLWRFQGSKVPGFTFQVVTCGVLTSVHDMHMHMLHVHAHVTCSGEVPGSRFLGEGGTPHQISGRHISKLISDPFLLMVMPWVVPGLDGWTDAQAARSSASETAAALVG